MTERPSTSPLTYSDAGVSIANSEKAVSSIRDLVRSTNRPEVLSDIGSFGGLFALGQYQEPVLVSSTDGVGTKIEIANDLNKFDTIGIDLVAMCVNDLIVQGAKPYLFLDYMSVSKIDLDKLKNLVKGIIKGCNLSECKLVGGETAEMPGTYTKEKFDIAGFAVGLVEKKKILNKKIRYNDLILAVPSNGLHSNGFSLVRYLLKKK